MNQFSGNSATKPTWKSPQPDPLLKALQSILGAASVLFAGLVTGANALATPNGDPQVLYLKLANRLDERERNAAITLLASASAHAGDLDRALALADSQAGFTKVITQKSIAKVLARKGDRAGALAVIEKIPAADKNSAYFSAAWMLAKAGDKKGTLLVFDKIKPDNRVFYLCGIAEKVVWPVDRAWARELFTQATAWAEAIEGPKKAEHLAIIAQFLIDLGEEASAERIINKIKTLNANNQARAWAGIAWSYSKVGKQEKAAELLGEALALAEHLNGAEFSKTLHSIVMSIDDNIDPPASEKPWLKAHALTDKLNKADAFKQLRIIAPHLAKAGHFKQAVAAAAKLQAGKRIDVHCEIATAMAKLGALAKANDLLATTLAEARRLKGHDSLFAKESIAMAYAEIGETAKAVAIIQQFTKKQSRQENFSSVAVCRARNGDPAGAMSLIEKFDTNDQPELIHLIAQTLADAGHTAAALKVANRLNGAAKAAALRNVTWALNYARQYNDALEVARMLHGPDRADGLRWVGQALAENGEPARGHRLLGEAFAVAMNVPDRIDDKVFTLLMVAEDMKDAGNTAKAREFLDQIIPLAKKLNANDRASIFHRISELLLECGDYTGALSHANEQRGDNRNYILFEITKAIVIRKIPVPKQPRSFYRTLNKKITPLDQKHLKQIAAMVE